MSEKLQMIEAAGAPAAIGPYSHAVRTGDFLFCSGQLPLDPATMKIVDGGIADEAGQVLKNLASVLASQSLGMDAVVKTTIFLTDMADFPAVNPIYAEAFGGHKPARSTVQVAALPLGARIEIEAVAVF